MKKFGKILFTFAFFIVGVFVLNPLRAFAAIPIYNYSDLEVSSYEYALVNNASGKISSFGVTDGLAGLSGHTDNYQAALRNFYGSSSGASSVGSALYTFRVADGQTFGSSDSATVRIRIPQAYLDINNFANGTAAEHVYLVRFNDDLSSHVSTYSIKGKLQNDNTFAPVAGTTMEIKQGNFATDISVIRDDSFLSDYYVEFTTNDISSTGVTYYGLVICNAPEYVPTEPEEQQPVTTTTTTTTTTVVTTTVENPKTLDGNSQLYIVIGVIGLVGILGLGAKFAKSSK